MKPSLPVLGFCLFICALLCCVAAIFEDPRVHFHPPQNFMNDPNGLLFDGKYWHMYYQYNPNGNVAGNQTWGHAVSTDLLHWKILPIAIPMNPDGGLIFSGSAVLDQNNTSGFFPGSSGIVAIYTVAEPPSLGQVQDQNIAYSQDGGLTFTKYSGNPVIDLKDKSFRDPFVTWDHVTNSWRMSVARSFEQQVLFYSSRDLINWNYLTRYTSIRDLGTYECPALIQVPIVGTNQTKYVLFISAAQDNVFGVTYIIGNWDGKRFEALTPPRRVDHGPDFYALTFWNGAQINGLPVGIAWMNNWKYANSVPSNSYRGVMSLPRVFDIVPISEFPGFTLRNRFISLRPLVKSILFKKQEIFDFNTTVQTNGETFVVASIFDAKLLDNRLIFAIQNQQYEEVLVNFVMQSEPKKSYILIERSNTWGFFDPAYEQNIIIPWEPKPISSMLMVVDQSCLELEVDGGEITATVLFYMSQPTQITVKNIYQTTILNLEIGTLNAI